MRKYVILGPQGCGKGTQAKLLEQEYSIVHISVGDIFRWHAKNRTKLGAQIGRLVAEGLLVPDDIVERVVKERLDQHDWNFGFTIDGFPRNESQARFFLESYDTDAVIHLEVPDAIVTARVLARRLCSSCGLDYNLIFHRPAAPDRCDVCGGTLIARADDHPDALQKRLAEYRDRTFPILELFRRKELVLSVDASRPVDAVYEDLRQQLRLPPPTTA